jgi:hypothetical protein
MHACISKRAQKDARISSARKDTHPTIHSFIHTYISNKAQKEARISSARKATHPTIHAYIHKSARRLKKRPEF